MVGGADKVLVALLEGYKATLLGTGAASDKEWNDALGLGEVGGMTSGEIAKVRAEFVDKPPRISLAYPRRNGPWPLWSVILAEGSPEQEYAGKGADVQVPTEGDPEQVYVMNIEQAVMVAVHVEQNPDTARIHADLVMAAMMQGGDTLYDAGLDGYGFNGAADLAPDPAILPEHVFVRAQTWTFSLTLSKRKVWGGRLIRPPVYVANKTAVVDDAGHTGGAEPSTQV